MRIKSLKSVRANYQQLMQFLYDISVDREVDGAIAAKASGFYSFMESFECIFYLTMMIKIFHRIEILNADLQKSNLSVIESYEKIEAVTDVLYSSRDSKFEEIYRKSFQSSTDFEINDPQVHVSAKFPSASTKVRAKIFDLNHLKIFSENLTLRFMIKFLCR